jgi:hypothetical protein
MTKRNTTDSFMGRSFDEWSQIDTALKQVNIKDGKELLQVLTKMSKKGTQNGFAIFDMHNSSRLLGYWASTVPASCMRSGHFRVAVHEKFPIRMVSDYDFADTMKTEIVEFTTHLGSITDYGFAQLTFHTVAKLETLMKVPAFWLPGENDAQKRAREHYSR